jgi:hypothetical protein
MHVPGLLMFSVPTMKKAKVGKVPVLENAFEVNLPKLMRSAKKLGTNRLVLDDGDIRTVVQLTETRLAIKLGGKVWLAAGRHCVGFVPRRTVTPPPEVPSRARGEFSVSVLQ